MLLLGLWLISKDKIPWLTIIGSSNYGRRSMTRDVEAQLVLLTKNKSLQQKMKHVSQSFDLLQARVYMLKC
jgi:CDP-diacylglycerol--glycerol-3-phosphate 3-phosphatidyltransferase